MPGRTYSTPNYRFGFNGQDKDDEISSVSGANTTALFWEYDSRLGRRWNVDPVFEAHLSPYHSFSDNPIMNIDPEGSHYYYTNSGLFIKSTDEVDKNGNQLIQIDIGDKNVTSSQLDLSDAHSRLVMARVIGDLANRVGIKYSYTNAPNTDGRVGIRKEDTKNGNSTILAYTDQMDKSIYALYSGNSMDKSYDNVFDAMSILEHESIHKKRGTMGSYSDHANVYISAMQTSNFGKSSKEYQIGAAASLASYLLSAANKDGGSATEFPGINIDDMVDNFNKTNTAGLKLGWEHKNLEYNKTLYIYDSNNIAVGSVNYDKDLKIE